MTGTGRIFRPTSPEGYEWALPIDSSDYEVFRDLPERAPGDPWHPIRMELIKEDDRGRPQKRANMPILGSNVLILRDEAIEIVGPLLQRHGELLPLLCAEARLAVFSAPLIEGAVDLEKSEIVRFSDGGILRFGRTVFREDVLKDVMAFKLHETPRGYLYLAEPLVDAILATGMTTGTTFTVAK